MRFKSFIFTILCCLLTISSLAQKGVIKEFNNQELPQQLLQHLNQATSEKDKQKANDQLVTAFTRVYNDMDLATKDRVVEISNVLLRLRVKQLPDVYNYVSTLTAFYNINAKDQNFDQWLSCIEFIQRRNKKVKDFTDFIEFTQQFLQDRTLCRTRAASWQTQQGLDFRLHLEGNEIVISFDKTFELYYASDKDNGTIYGTTGDYYYFDNKWVGRGGRLNWDRTGLPTTQCWAVLGRYEAITKFPKFTADSVLFTNTKYFTEPVIGRVEEQLNSPMEPEKYTFPKFRSYQKDFELKDVLPGVDYSGTFMMNGSKFLTSDTKNPATLIFHRDGKKFLSVQSTKFTITSNRIVSENAAVKMFLDGDSITNNGILVRYNASDKQVTLVNDSKRNYYSPYSNTFHNLDMYCENMVWKMNEDVLDFSMLTGTSGSQNFSTFESSSYYSEAKYRQIQAQDEVSPAQRVYRYMRNQGMAYEFYIDEFAQFIKMDVMQAKLMIHNLAHHGLVSFNEATGRVYVKDKLVDYVHAFAKDKKSKFDYDALVFESNSKGSNAILDLKSNDILMHGVEHFVLSDSQQVVIYPKNGDMIVHKNRDIEFSGRVNAGRFVSYVTNATFRYDEFRIDLPQVDSMYFYVTNFNDPEKEHIVYTPLYNLVGNIQIDSSNNHSGLKDTKDYPIFTSTKDCYVYYDRKDIYNGTYVRDRFYYTINPFVVKDMVDFKTDDLEFNGTLTSAGIFPDIKEPLKVQRDYSLGFELETTRSGLPAYGGKGQFKEHIDLSYRGLRGQGKLTYLSATIESKEMVFMPDSMQSVSDTFYVKEDATFPQICNSRCAQHWFPYQDSMRVVQLAKGPEFKMYRGDALLAGYVTLRPAGANARGSVTIGEGTITSQHFTLQPRLMDAQVSHFVLRSDIYRNIAFEAHNMKSHTDYDKRFAEFTANAPIERTTLPLLQYAAYVDKFTWQIDKKELELLDSKSESTGGLEGLSLRERHAHANQPGAFFLSTDPKRDSLQFHSVHASYLYNQGQLSCKDVFVLNTGDAVIAPAGDTLHIRQGGSIDLLKNSQLLANRANRYHLIYDADLLVEGAKKFSGKGYIDYVDENDKKQKIFLDEIAPNTQGMTVGKGFIADSASFHLNDAFGFAGNVRVDADSAFYYFDGGIRLLHNCAPAESLGLLAYAAYTDPKMVLVNVPELPTDWKGNRITASILFDKSATMEPRNAFLTNERAADNELMTAHGVLYYNNETGAYTISSREKIDDPDNVVAQYLSLDTKSCLVTGEGPIDFNLRNNFTKMFCYGMAELDTKNQENTEFNSMFGFYFPIDEKVQNTLQQLISDDLRLSPSNADNEVVRHAMMYYMGAEAGADNYSSYVSSGFYEKMPAVFENTLLFEGIKWKYSPSLGYYYNGMAGLAAIGKKQMHLNTRVKAQIYKRGTGVYLILYVQIASDHWYYFNYEFNSQTLNIYSSAGEWIDMIKQIPADKRTIQGKDMGSYRYRVGSSRTEVNNFLLRIEGLNKNGQVPDDEEDEDDVIPGEDEE